MRRRVYKGLFLAVIIICTFLFAKEIKTASQLFPHVDKVAHFAIFFALAAVMNRAFKLPFLAQISLLALYGASVELMQDMIPYREASVADFVADVLGALCFFAVHYLWLRKRQLA